MKSFYKFFAVLFLLAANFYGQDTLIINKEYIPYPDTTLVFIPNDAQTQSPLLILLHGWSGNYKQWNSLVDLTQVSNDLGFVIACPDGFYDSYYVDSKINKDVQFETFFWEDLIPNLLEQYPIDSENIFISGLSMGGHGAISLFLKNPKLFKAAGSTSGVLNLSDYPNRPSIKSSHGDYGKYKGSWKNNSSFYLLDGFKESNKWMIIDCGVDDFFYETNVKFYEKCRELKLRVKFISQPGRHDRNYWANSIRDHFFFFKSLVKKDIPN